MYLKDWLEGVFSYNGKGDKMLSKETDKCQLVLYVGQFQVAYFLGKVFLMWDIRIKTNKINSAENSSFVKLTQTFNFP